FPDLLLVREHLTTVSRLPSLPGCPARRDRFQRCSTSKHCHCLLREPIHSTVPHRQRSDGRYLPVCSVLSVPEHLPNRSASYDHWSLTDRSSIQPPGQRSSRAASFRQLRSDTKPLRLRCCYTDLLQLQISI